MRWSRQLTEYSERFWRERREKLGKLGEKADGILAACSPDESLLLKYIFATLPLSDLGDYDPALLLGFVKNALEARKEFPWCTALPEHLFLLHVVYPRINTEELADCRGLFHDALADRVRGLSLEEAILEVNRWCAEEATYRSTDLCTASPLAVYRCGYGRCGEESTFTVTALRSVGIAARQVYVPWWSHCDDNHAWVEVFDGKCWRYLGACEPEPELDRGWFTSAASRAMMIHARTFVQGEKSDFSFLFPDADPVNLYVEQGVAYEAVTARYGETLLVTVLVKNEEGKPVSNARVFFSVLNMARFSEIAVLKTGQNGECTIRLGLGSVKISAFVGSCCAEKIIDVLKGDFAELILKDTGSLFEKSEWSDFDFKPPVGAAGYPPPLSPERKKLRRQWLDGAAALRERKMAQIGVQETEALTSQESQIWSTVTEKDRAGGIRRNVLLDSGGAFPFEPLYSKEVFENALLCPRIALEPLSPWRKEISAAFSEEQRASFREDPRKVWDWLGQTITETDSYSVLSGTPAGIFRLKAGNLMGKRVLFCALCRSFGVPARLSPLDGNPEYYADGAFHTVLTEKASAAVILQAPEHQPALFCQNYTLSRLLHGQYVTLDIGDIPAGESRRFSLEPGRYRALTVSRMPNGNQFAQRLEFSLAEGESREISLSFREGKAADLLECQALPPFTLWDREGKERHSSSLLAETPFSLLFWLEVGREPTEHILNELRESAEAFVSSGCALHFILEGPEQENDPTLKKALSLLSNTKIGHNKSKKQWPGRLLADCAYRLPRSPQVWYGDFQDTVPALARRMFGDPDKLPLVLLIDSKANGLYGCSGYNVGTGKLLLRLLSELVK